MAALELCEVTDPAALARLMRDAGADNHPVLKELGLYAFWGATTLALWEGGVPLSVISMKLGKRKKNIWEPYANWYGAYTLPSHRRKGLATQLYREMEDRAQTFGCRRLKSLAGSRAGLGLHMSLGHQAWGHTSNGEIQIDTPLPIYEEFYRDKGAPPTAIARKTQIPPGMLADIMRKGLRYDEKA